MRINHQQEVEALMDLEKQTLKINELDATIKANPIQTVAQVESVWTFKFPEDETSDYS